MQTIKIVIFTVLVCFLFQTSVTYIEYYYGDLGYSNSSAKELKKYDKIQNFAFHLTSFTRGEPIVHVLTERCTNYMWDKDRKITSRQWFNCNFIQNKLSDLLFIKGE